MKHIVLLLFLAASSAAQQHFYCDPEGSGPVTVSSSLTDFYLTTRRSNEAAYSAELNCEFNAESTSGAAFFVDIVDFKVGSTAVLTVSSDERVLFTGSKLEKYQTSMTTPSKKLKVRFDAAGDQSKSAGVTMRVRALTANGCPSGWTYLHGDCFGTNSYAGRLNFFDAQRACNNMRANLMQLPSGYSGTLGSLMRSLPYSLRSYWSWVGLTDRNSRFWHYWLNGHYQYRTSEISCISGGSSSTCLSYERCGAWRDRSTFYTVYMDDCADRNNFVCSMPPGGTDYFYVIPEQSGSWYRYSTPGWVWAIVAAGLFVTGLVIVGIYTCVRQSQTRRRRTAAGAGTVHYTPPPPGSYPTNQTTVYPTVQLQYPTQQQQHPPPQPPSYSASAQVNPGYEK